MPDQATESPSEMTVFYDGGCPLCSREIHQYQGLRGADDVEWVDICSAEHRLKDAGIDYNTAMARFHVLDREGNWHTGAYGFARLWRALPALSIPARLARLPGVLPLLDRVYNLFASRRLKHRQLSGEKSGHST